jgi:hypothetical protein
VDGAGGFIAAFGPDFGFRVVVGETDAAGARSGYGQDQHSGAVSVSKHRVPPKTVSAFSALDIQGHRAARGHRIILRSRV